jgi:hypothetical protein
MIECGFFLWIGHCLCEMCYCNGKENHQGLILLQMILENSALILVFLGIRYKLIRFTALLKKDPGKAGEIQKLFEESVIIRRGETK